MSSDEQSGPNILQKCVRFVFGQKPSETVRETIEDLIEEAGENGEECFSEHEQLLLNNILNLKDKKCSQVMIPRAEILAFHSQGTVQELAEFMVTKGHSRIPIYGTSLDDIVGVVHILDVAKMLLQDKGQSPVTEMLGNPVKFVSPSMRVLDLLRDMQLGKVHLAMVVDEYGGVDGLITIEDLLEEIVGDIEDEYDNYVDPIITTEGSTITTDARAELDEIKEATGLDLHQELDDEEIELDTIGGYVFHLAQRIPNRGEVIEGKHGIKFRILEVDPRRIKKIMIVLPEPKTEDNHEK